MPSPSRRCVTPVAAMLCVVVLLGFAPLCAQDESGEDATPANPPSDKPLNLDLSFLWDSRNQGESSWIIAKVNDEVITRHEVLSRILGELEGLARSYPKEQFEHKARERWKKTVYELVDEKLLLQVAKKEEITVAEADVDKALADEIKKLGGQAKFEQNLTQQGTTQAKHREQVRRELTMREVILKKIGAKGSINVMGNQRMPKDIYVPPAEIRKYYEDHRKDYYIQEKVKPRQIILTFRDSQSRSTAEEEGHAVQRLLEAGADFGLLAHWVSAVYAKDDGLCPESPRGTYPEEIEKVMFSIKEGEVSPLIESEGNFRLVRIESRTQAQQRTFEEVQEEIKKFLQNRRVMENVDEVKKEIKKNSFIWPRELMTDRDRDRDH